MMPSEDDLWDMLSGANRAQALATLSVYYHYKCLKLPDGSRLHAKPCANKSDID